MKPRITIRLFGRFSVHLGGQELLIHSSKAREILAYLAVNRRSSVPREALASLIAPDSSDERSRKALRQALWQLREGLAGEGDGIGPEILDVDAHWAQIAPENQVWIDVHEFERSAGPPGAPTEGAPHPGDVELLRHAAQLYRGELLQGWYQEWCLTERERLKQIYLEALDRLLAHFEAARSVEAGVAYASLALRADPARECTHRALMRLYCIAGDRASAIRQYERCVEILRADLGIRPDDETQALERAIRAGHAVSVAPPLDGEAVRRRRDIRRDVRETP